MKKDTAKLKISISGNSEGKESNKELSPLNFDISELIKVLTHIENLIRPVNQDGSLITYKITTGSVLNEIEISKGTIENLNNIFYMVNEKKSLTGIDIKQAEAIEFFQEMSKDKERTINITNTLDPNIELNITPYTNYRIVEDLFINIDLTLYGKVTYIGGKNNPSIHLDTQEYGVVTIRVKEYILKQIQENIIYKELGINVSAEQSVYTYKIQNAFFKSFVEYSREYDQDYIKDLVENGKEIWKDVTDTDKWLRNIRG